MAVQIDQKLCVGCGACAEACSGGAIYFASRHAVIDETLCTQCQACIDICQNGAIIAISETAQSMPVVAKPIAKTRIIPSSPHASASETPPCTRSPAPFAGAALAFLGREVAPRMVNMRTRYHGGSAHHIGNRKGRR